jgi:phage terminase large subunit
LGSYERNAIANIKAHPQLAKLDKKIIDELEKVKRQDPEKLRIAMCGNMHGNG